MIKFYHKHLSNISNESSIGDGSTIHSHVVIYDGVKIGRRCKIQAQVFIPNGVTIGDDVFIGPGVTFTNDARPPSEGKHWKETFVENGAVIGVRAIILPGVTIGKGAMVGAGALVTKDVPDGECWIGSPARFHKMRKDL